MFPETINFKLSKLNFALFRKVGGSARFLGGTSGKIGLNVEKMHIFPGLKQAIFQFVLDTLEHRPYTFF